jgi:hypothetical protein
MWHLSAGDEQSISALNIYILWDMADWFYTWFLLNFQESIFSPSPVQNTDSEVDKVYNVNKSYLESSPSPRFGQAATTRDSI